MGHAKINEQAPHAWVIRGENIFQKHPREVKFAGRRPCLRCHVVTESIMVRAIRNAGSNAALKSHFAFDTPAITA